MEYARQCDKTKEGMNEGWVVGDGEAYYKYESDILARCKEAGYADLNEAYDDEFMYWTEWEDDFQYVEIDGILHDKEELDEA
jgi:hypothetical protein